MALSLLLVTQTMAINVWSSAAYAADDTTEAAPSWNDIHSESSKIVDGTGSTTSGAAAPAPAAQPAEVKEAAQPEAKAGIKAEAKSETTTEAKAESKAETASSDVKDNERSSGDGKAIAEAARVNGATAADAAILRPAHIENSVESKDEEKNSETEKPASEVMVVDSDSANKSETSTATEAATTVKKDGAADSALSTNGTAGATTINSAEISPVQLAAPAGDLSAPPVTSAVITPGTDETASKAAPQVGSGGTLGTADSLSAEMLRNLGATVTVNDEAGDGVVTQDGVLVVDCDEKQQVQDEIKYENLPTDEGKTHIRAGAVFPVVVSSQLSSKTAKKGDAIEARLKYDLKIGDKLIAHRGAVVNGHINYALKARSVMHSLVSPERWYRNSGCLGLEFDEIINEKGEHLPLVACPARAARVVKNKNEGRELGVNHLGQVTGPWSQQLRYKAVRIGLNAAMAPCGVFSFGAMPVALGLIGAANPSFAFMKPVGQNVRHRRLKGFAWGFLSGVPGSWIIEDTVTKGQESVIKPGDEFLAEFRQEFNGEPASEAQLMPNASVKVHGHVSGKKEK